MTSSFRGWLVLVTVFVPWSFAFAADNSAARPQIQSSNLRIEFDNRLRTRVVARFDGKEDGHGAVHSF